MKTFLLVLAVAVIAYTAYLGWPIAAAKFKKWYLHARNTVEDKWDEVNDKIRGD